MNCREDAENDSGQQCPLWPVRLPRLLEVPVNCATGRTAGELQGERQERTSGPGHRDRLPASRQGRAPIDLGELLARLWFCPPGQDSTSGSSSPKTHLALPRTGPRRGRGVQTGRAVLLASLLSSCRSPFCVVQESSPSSTAPVWRSIWLRPKEVLRVLSLPPPRPPRAQLKRDELSQAMQQVSRPRSPPRSYPARTSIHGSRVSPSMEEPGCETRARGLVSR